MESSRAIQERIDDLRIRGRAIVDAAKAQQRQLSDDELGEFNNITDVLLPEAEKQFASAVAIENKVVALSAEKRLQEKYNAISTALDDQTPSRPRVLPTNGILPGEGASSGNAHFRHSKLKCFTDNQSAFDAGMWMRAVVAKERNREDVRALQHCREHGLSISNTMSEGTGATGGYLVPAQLAASIIEFREKVGVARQVCQVMPMSGDTLSLPKRTSGLTVYAPGEAASITASDAAVSQIELINKKRAVLSQLSQELSDDSLVSVTDFLFTEMAYALALQEDKELINGTGAATTYFGVRGLLNRIGSAGVSTAATGHDTWPELDLADVMACMSLLPERYTRELSWICSRNFYFGVLLRLEAAGGGNTIATLSAGASGNPTFMGYPVRITHQMPVATAAATVCALFGSFSEAVVLGDRGGISLARSDDYGFASDLITLRATSRYDMNVHEPGDSSNAGAYVALKTAS